MKLFLHALCLPVLALSLFSCSDPVLAVAKPILAPAAVRTTEASEQFSRGKEAILKMTGCYLVDYSYMETESLKEGYVTDKRVYDVNKVRSVKEWIYADEITERRIRLQHVLFATELDGTMMNYSLLKHTGEDWDFEAPFRYEFVNTKHWEVVDQKDMKDTWTRRITGLDDGLRYQCSAPWKLDTAYPEWSCASYSPIPGREFRDMGRKDYQGMDRFTRLMVYGNSFLERQENIKVIQNDAVKTPLAKELGKNWYVRLPDAECAVAVEYVEPRHEFWKVILESWNEVFTGDSSFREKNIPGRPGRYPEIMGLEDKYMTQNLQDRGVREQAKSEILTLIEAYRER